MNVLITGITGSGGSYLAEYILKNHPEYKVWGTSRWHSTSILNNIKDIKDKIIVKECDLNDLSSIIRLLQECNPVKIFNLASTANVYVSFITPLAVLQNNIFGTVNLLEAIRIVCPDTIFQQCSTSELYGTPEQFPITEEHKINPNNIYSVSKTTQDLLVNVYHKAYKIKTITTRAFCYWNPRRSDLFASSFARQIVLIEKGKQDVLYHGNLESIRAGMDVREMVEAYWVASEKCEYGIPYNLGGTQPVSVGEILEILKSKAKVPIRSEQNIDLLRKTDITNQVPDVSKFYNQTGWKPKITLDESMEWLLDYYRREINEH